MENDEKFKNKIPEGYGFYKSVGISSIDKLSKEIVLLDDFHVMVKIH